MKTTLIAVLATLGVAMAVPQHSQHCKVNGKLGKCMSTSKECKGGSFHKGSPPHWPCVGGEDVQCCIKTGHGGNGTASSTGIVPSGTGIVPSGIGSAPNGTGIAPTGTAPSGTAPSHFGPSDVTIGIPAKGNSVAAPAAGGPIAGLNAAQSAHAWAIMGEVRAENLPRQACLAAFATGMVESSLRILANNGVPASLGFASDGLGSDHDSIGIFQQRASIYKDIAADMDAAGSARQFFAVMKGIPGWQTMDVGTLCQKVQRSAFPARYGQQVGLATKICAAGGL